MTLGAPQQSSRTNRCNGFRSVRRGTLPSDLNPPVIIPRSSRSSQRVAIPRSSRSSQRLVIPRSSRSSQRVSIPRSSRSSQRLVIPDSSRSSQRLVIPRSSGIPSTVVIPAPITSFPRRRESSSLHPKSIHTSTHATTKSNRTS